MTLCVTCPCIYNQGQQPSLLSYDDSHLKNFLSERLQDSYGEINADTRKSGPAPLVSLKEDDYG